MFTFCTLQPKKLINVDFSVAFDKIPAFIGYFTFENVWMLVVENTRLVQHCLLKCF